MGASRLTPVPPFEFFNTLLSSGEQLFTNALVTVEDTLGHGLSKGYGTLHW